MTRDRLDGRLGFDQPAGWWPAPPRCKAIEAAGFGWLQVTAPAAGVLLDREAVEAHASALRTSLALTDLRLVAHAPGSLVAGTRESDRGLAGAIAYASSAGAEVLVLHPAPVARGARAGDRAAAEVRSLTRLAARAESAGLRLAIENLAPEWPGDDAGPYRLARIAELVAALDRPAAGLCLDVGHAWITEGAALTEAIAPLLDQVLVFELHDNFGAAGGAERPGSLDPLRLDLHLPPGAGTVPWRAIAPLLCEHAAPLQLGIHPAQRPEPGTLAVLARETLRAERERV